jgi:hypothetical protein
MKKIWITRFTFAIIAASVLDIVSTYIATPDLSHELNPLLVMFGRKWTHTIILKVCASLLGVVAFAGSLYILESRVERMKGKTGFLDIMGHLVFKHQVSPYEFLFYAWPKDWVAVLAVTLLAFGISIVVGGLTATVTNTFRLIQSYSGFMVFLFLGGFMGVFIALRLAYLFFVKQPKAA